MLKIEVVEKIYHTTTLSDREEQKILRYIKDNPEKFEYMDEKRKITQAAWDLYFIDEIDIYKDTVDTETETEEIRWSEFEERMAEEILKGIE